MTLARQFLALCACRKRPVVYALVCVVAVLTVLATRWRLRPLRDLTAASPTFARYSTSPYSLSATHVDLPSNGRQLHRNRKKTSHSLEWRATVPPNPPTHSSDNMISDTIFAIADSARTNRTLAQGIDGKYRYVLGMNYWEQFNMAMKNFFGLACLTKRWNASVVTPFTAHSRLYGLDSMQLDDYINSTQTAHALGLILDISSVNTALAQQGFHSSAPLQEMLSYGERKLMFLHFVAAKATREYRIKSRETDTFLKHAFGKSGVVDCSTQPELLQLARLVALNLNSRLNDLTLRPSQLKKEPFQVHKYLCVDMNHTSSPEGLAAELGLSGVDNASIVIVNWRGSSTGAAVQTSAKGAHSNNRITMQNTCLDNRHSKQSIHFSSAVLAASEGFMLRLGVTAGNYIVVHIRSEKMYLRQPRFPKLVKNCVKEAIAVKDKLLLSSKEDGALPRVLYFSDFGPFGSETCKGCRTIGQVLSVLGTHGDTVTHFDPSDFNLPPDNGLVAAVEMVVMSHARHLVLVGGGAFQNQLAMHFHEHQRTLKTNGILRKGKTAPTWMCSSDKEASEVTLKYTIPV